MSVDRGQESSLKPTALSKASSIHLSIPNFPMLRRLKKINISNVLYIFNVIVVHAQLARERREFPPIASPNYRRETRELIHGFMSILLIYEKHKIKEGGGIIFISKNAITFKFSIESLNFDIIHRFYKQF